MSEWKIYISGYGTFDFSGNEDEAKVRCAQKLDQEGGIGLWWIADLEAQEDCDREAENAALIIDAAQNELHEVMAEWD